MSEQASGTSTPGNTSAGVQYTQKRRNYFVTFWDPVYKHAELPKGAKFLIECDDKTLEGQWHGHAFIYFKNPIAFSTIKKLFGKTCHVEIPISNSQCIAYVRGEITHEENPDAATAKTNIREFGELPMDNGVKQSVKELKKINDVEDIEDPRLVKTWWFLKTMPKKIKSNEWHKTITVKYFYNPRSGKGKSKAIQDYLEENGIEEFEDVKHAGDFWIGVVDGTGCAVYDDFRPSDVKAKEFINFIDYNVHTLNVKGGAIQNRYDTILISSVIPIEKLYRTMDEEDRQQWIRRMEYVPIGKIPKEPSETEDD